VIGLGIKKNYAMLTLETFLTHLWSTSERSRKCQA